MHATHDAQTLDVSCKQCWGDSILVNVNWESKCLTITCETCGDFITFSRTPAGEGSALEFCEYKTLDRGRDVKGDVVQTKG